MSLSLPFSLPTRSTAEAIQLLKLTRRALILRARAVARELIERDGETTTRAVLHELERRGRVDAGAEVSDHWLGAVFRDPAFRWTGRFTTYTDTRPRANGTRRNIHERTIKVWTLA